MEGMEEEGAWEGLRAITSPNSHHTPHHMPLNTFKHNKGARGRGGGGGGGAFVKEGVMCGKIRSRGHLKEVKWRWVFDQ